MSTVYVPGKEFVDGFTLDGKRNAVCRNSRFNKFPFCWKK